MKWRRLRPGRKKLRRLMARIDAAGHKFMGTDHFPRTTASEVLMSREVSGPVDNSVHEAVLMWFKDRRQWRRYERKRKRAGL